MFFASASHSVSPTTSASHARIDLSSRRFTGRRSVLSSRRPLGGVSDAHHRRVGSRIDDVSVVAAAAAAPGADDEIAMLTKMLQLAKERKEHEATAGDEQKTASKGGYDGTRFDFWDFYRALFDSSKGGEKEIFSTYREQRSRCGRTVRDSNVEAHVARVEEPLEPPTMGTDRRYVRTSSSSIEERESVRRLAATKY